MSAPNVPFPIEEYRDRARRVREEMARRDIDVLYVMSPSNLCYLTGFESIWYPPRAPLGVARRTATTSASSSWTTSATSTWSASRRTSTRPSSTGTTTPWRRSPTRSRERGWAGGSVGIERWTQSPAAPLVDEVAEAIAATGARVVDGDWTSTGCGSSSRRRSSSGCGAPAEIVDAAFAALPGEVRPGMTELQIASRLDGLMAELGGEPAAIRTMVSAGPDVWCPHARRPRPAAGRAR